jgi:hypothetical protein
MANWYAVEQDVSRTGRSQIIYVQSDNATNAVAPYPGGILLGGPYSSEAAAEKAHPQGSSGSTADAAGLPAPTANTTTSNPLGGLAAIGDFFSNLTSEHTWERVAEFIVGGILLYVGIKALATPGGAQVAQQNLKKTAKNVVFGSAQKVAKKAGPEARVVRRVAAKRIAPKTTARVARHREYVKQYGGKKPAA